MAVIPSEPLEATITRLIGPPHRREGGAPGRPWWCCPFHTEDSPSFSIIPGTNRWICFGGCGDSGDTTNFIQNLYPSISFLEAVKVARGSLPPRTAPRRPTRAPAPREAPRRPDGWQDLAREVV